MTPIIKQIGIYDLTGKLIYTQNYFEDKTEEIQLNVEKLSTGMYLLQLQTDENVLVKKLIKK
ncbi:T9SS type A sorting domain-containing protein [Flavobacterium arsenatis]|uniref:T9SS type A sorting domain-containing protein n=1 Tax=Flavobacterium arsenatis TaxID=1484332 RepID=UPI0035B53E81